MTVTISFMQYAGVGTKNEMALGRCRIRETFATVPGTTTATAQDGEIVLIGNAEGTMILAANGTTPDAQANTATAATSAGFPVADSSVFAVKVSTGDKINVKAHV